MSEITRTEPIRPSIANLMPPAMVDSLQRRALLAGVIAALLCILGAATHPHQFLRSYLVGYIMGLGLSLGSLGLLMVQYLTKGNWGFLIRRQLEAGSRVLPLMAILFIPLGIGVWNHNLYPWANTKLLSPEDLQQFKMRAYLTPQWFIVRAIVYFALWIVLAYFLNKWGKQQDYEDVPDLPRSRRYQKLCGPGLVLFCITVTMAVVDWIMSLDIHWYSTMYGLIFIDGQGLITMCFMIMLTAALFKYRPMSQVLVPKTLHDLGNLTLAMVMLFAYFSFSQFLIIWSGNLPEEIHWYVDRLKGAWASVAFAIVLFHFAIPFFLLLHKPIKRNLKTLVPVVVILFLARYIDLLWYIVPNFNHMVNGVSDPRGAFSWMDLACPVAVVGLWIAAFCGQLKSRPLFPVYDPLWTEVEKLHGR
ncbi:MAG: hypothetical protein DMG67_04790 [Acidobacteria bacterium]|nr:MAG: hypothetical protein DMG67_04790 [Acidobacteriota bacterium]